MPLSLRLPLGPSTHVTAQDRSLTLPASLPNLPPYVRLPAPVPAAFNLPRCLLWLAEPFSWCNDLTVQPYTCHRGRRRTRHYLQCNTYRSDSAAVATTTLYHMLTCHPLTTQPCCYRYRPGTNIVTVDCRSLREHHMALSNGTVENVVATCLTYLRMNNAATAHTYATARTPDVFLLPGLNLITAMQH